MSTWIPLDTLLTNYGIFPGSIHQERNLCKRKGTSSIYIRQLEDGHRRLVIDITYLLSAKDYQLDQIELARTAYHTLLSAGYTEYDLITHLSERTGMTYQSWYHFFYQQLFDSTCGKPDSLMSYQVPKRIQLFIHHIKGLL